MRRASVGAIVDMSTHSSPSGAPSSDAVLAEQHRLDLRAVHDHRDHDLGVGRDLGRRVGDRSAVLVRPRRSAVARVRLKTTRSWPARRRLAAIREPMIPRPMKPTLM